MNCLYNELRFLIGKKKRCILIKVILFEVFVVG